MADLVFDVYGPPVENDLGTRLIRITREMYGPGTFYRHTLSGTGSGQIIVERDQSFVTAENFAEGNYVIVRDLDLHPSSDTQNVLGGFVFEQDFLRVIADPGQRVYRFGGPSTIALLARAIMGPESLSPFEGPSSIVDGYWRWGSDTYGGVWRRALFEANLQDPPGLPMVDTAWVGADNIFWNDDDDSNGDAWPSFVGDFRTRCGTDLLTLGFQLFGFGIEHAIDAASFDMYAYNENGYGTDRSSGSFASGKVRFTVGVNIAKTLDRTAHGQLPLTHILVRTTDMPEGVWFENPAYTPGDPVRKAAYQTGDISGDPAESPAVTARVNRLFSIRKQAEDGVEFYSSKPRNDPLNGGYQAGPNYATGPAVCLNAHYWVGDWITVNSGSGEHDYVNATKRVESITYELTTAADDDDHGWNIIIGVGPRVGSLGTTQMSEPADAVAVGEMCQALTPGTEQVLRLYPSANTTTMTTAPADDAAWNGGQPSLKQLKTTADGSLSAASSTDSQNGVVNADLWRGSFALTSGLAAILAAGGATAVAYFMGNARFGIGISESNQYVISQIGLRVSQGDSTTIRGTALALHSLSAGNKWPASSAKQSRRFPPVGANDVLSAVPGSAVGDFLIAEFGGRNLYTGPGGMTLRVTNDTGSDLIESEGQTTTGIPWLEIRSTSAPTGSGLNPDLVGTSNQKSRCDHSHHVISNRDPTTADDITQGFPVKTLWTNTESNVTWLLIDEDTGEWIVQSAPLAAHDHETTDILDLDLDSLIDVDTTGVADNDVLTYDSADSTWKPAAGGGGGGAPTTADYLVGTAQGGLSAEIVVGTTPGGELGGTWASPTVDATHSGSAHHAESHQSRHNAAGADALKLDDLAAPDDNTDLNATTGAHGLLPKLGGGSTNYLRADGSWSNPGASGGAVFGPGYAVRALPEGSGYEGGTGGLTPASTAYATLVTIPAPMKLRALRVRVITTTTGTDEWGIFDTASLTKIAGGSGVFGASGWQNINATGAPVDVAPGQYVLILARPASGLGSLGVLNGASLTPWISKGSYTWTNTPSFASGWSDYANRPNLHLVGDMDGSGTQWVGG